MDAVVASIYGLPITVPAMPLSTGHEVGLPHLDLVILKEIFMKTAGELHPLPFLLSSV
jgi:hypothetical protein